MGNPPTRNARGSTLNDLKQQHARSQDTDATNFRRTRGGKGFSDFKKISGGGVSSFSSPKKDQLPSITSGLPAIIRLKKTAVFRARL